MCFAATFGGVLTLIGTSTNLIVNSFPHQDGAKPLGMFDFFMVGAGTLLTGLIAVLLFARHLPEQDTEMSRESGYFLEAKVGPGSPMAGRSVKENGLRSLKSLYLAEIIRGNQVICPVQPEHELHEGTCCCSAATWRASACCRSSKGWISTASTASTASTWWR